MTLKLRFARRDRSAQQYALAAENGGVSITGAAAVTAAGRRIIASSGAVAVTGIAIADPPSLAIGAIDDLALEGRAVLSWTDPQRGGSGVFHGKHTNWQYCPADGKIYGFGGDGSYPNASLQSGAMNFGRVTWNGDATQVTYDQFYPHWGLAGIEYPVGADMCTFEWDSLRGSFWSYGGFGWGVPYMPSMTIGIEVIANPPEFMWRFHVTGAQAGQWEKVSTPAPKFYVVGNALDGMGGIYHPPSDTVMYLYGAGGDNRIYWRRLSDGATGRFSNGYPSPANENQKSYHQVYDPESNEFIYPTFNQSRLLATKLDNFVPTPNATGPSCTTRIIADGCFDGGQLSDQSPAFIRGSGASRKWYMIGLPKFPAPINNGSGLGIYEIGIVDGVVKQSAQPYFELMNKLTIDGHVPGQFHSPINAAAYDPAKDRIFATSQTESSGGGGGSALIFRWSAPSWTPAAGNVKALTTDISGAATNTFGSVFAPGGTHSGLNNSFWAWPSACYARNLSTNGAMLFHNGGDGDYWGTEVYAFDFDTRRWYRLDNPYSGIYSATHPDVLAWIAANPGVNTRYNFHWNFLPSTHASYFNTLDCEHGPAVADDYVGLLPVGTVPGVPHAYDGIEYLSGEFIGNRRGALVTPLRTFAFPTSSTSRAHYYDLDQVVNLGVTGVGSRWGRLSSNRLTIPGGALGLCAVDEEARRIYHNFGYLDLAATPKVQVPRSWNNLAYDTSATFDPRRRLWIEIIGADTQGSPGQLYAMAVDTSTTFQPLNLTGTRWDLWNGRYGGIVYVPPLDCFFFYNQARGDQLNEPQAIYKIQPPDTASASAALAGTWAVTRIVMPGDTVANNQGVRGTYGRLRWIPPLKCIAFYNATNFMYLYKPEGV